MRVKVNVLITSSHRACLADFALATPQDSESVEDSMGSEGGSVSFTRVGGSLRWLAPERLDSELNYNNTMAADVYAYGCLCYEVHTVLLLHAGPATHDTTGIFWQ
jgi:serine/threonine protein kinase